MTLRNLRAVLSITFALGLGTALIPWLAHAGEVEFSIHGIKKGAGNLRVAAYQSDQDFSKSRWVAAIESPATEIQTTVVFEDLPAGEYGFVAFQDHDGDDGISKNFLGIPIEIYGFSNGARGRLGPPSFEEARVTIPIARITLEINLE